MAKASRLGYHAPVRPLLLARTMDELVQMDEDEATRSYLDSHNCRVLFRLTGFFAVATAAGAVAMLGLGRQLELGLSVAVLVVLRALYLVRERPAFSRHFRPVLLAYLALQLVALRTLITAGAAVTAADMALPVLVLFFRLRWPPAAIPVAALWAVSCGRQLVAFAAAGDELDLVRVAGQSLISLAVLTLGDHLATTMRRIFVGDWRRESRRYRERSRMQEELGDARKIQLSMLPRTAPEIAWLDVAGISIPASEVGGDYYDYFTLSESRQVVVVADVAGHGVASGLLLSGIRSCLHLMHQDSSPEPTEVLARLDRMVRETTTRHFFVTLLYALFDADRGAVTLASAGHPPLLRYRAAGREVDELELPSLPLGTGLVSRRGQRTLTYAPDDIFLLYSDGIAETLNDRREVYGYGRLSQRLRGTAHDRSARELRNTLLEDIVTFKGDCEQTDDITLVVIKAR
jgi:serine phosphatase RsbU (regulator of sigma subunit)